MGKASPFPPIAVVAVMAFSHFAYSFTTVYPQLWTLTHPDRPDPGYVYGGSLPVVIFLYIVFNFLFWHAIWAFVQAMITDPGSIPKTLRWIKADFGIPKETEEKFRALLENRDAEPDSKVNVDLVKSLPVVERKKKDAQYRFCSTCNIFKPDRAHHCRVCDRCVLRMDHHCPWIANCVGFNNYKHFLLFLFYSSATSFFVCVAMFTRLLRAFRPITDTTTFVMSDLPVIVAFGFALFLFFALFWFFLVHMDYVFNSLTTIEMREKRNSDDPLVKHRWEVSHVKFDRGSTFQNFQHIFGSAWMWLLPIESDLAGTNGTYTEVETYSPPV